MKVKAEFSLKSRSIHSEFIAKLLGGLLLLVPIMSLAADPIAESRKLINSTNKKLARSQQQVNSLHSKTTRMYDAYKTAINESETYETYNQQLREIVKSQTEELNSLDQQIGDIEVTSKKIMPLMARMIDTLEAFVKQDLPFLPNERNKRVAELKDLMSRADLSIAEKYRKILEAYQIEIEYGKTLETYQAKLGDKTVNFLKIGRVALLYQTLDKKQTHVWNKHASNWQPVEDQEVKHSFELGMKMARKQQSPELLVILASKVESAK